MHTKCLEYVQKTYKKIDHHNLKDSNMQYMQKISKKGTITQKNMQRICRKYAEYAILCNGIFGSVRGS